MEKQENWAQKMTRISESNLHKQPRNSVLDAQLGGQSMLPNSQLHAGHNLALVTILSHSLTIIFVLCIVSSIYKFLEIYLRASSCSGCHKVERSMWTNKLQSFWIFSKHQLRLSASYRGPLITDVSEKRVLPPTTLCRYRIVLILNTICVDGTQQLVIFMRSDIVNGSFIWILRQDKVTVYDIRVQTNIIL